MGVGTITIKPSETDLVKLAEKGNYSPAPFLDKTMGRLGKIKKDAKFFMTNKRQKSKSGSVSEDPNLEMQTGEPTERGYAFSQEEHGAVSQKDLVRAYSRTDTRRYLQAARVGSHATSEPTGAVSQRKYHGSTVVVKEFDTPSPTKTVVKTQ